MSNILKSRKVVLVGCGFVGMSFIYSAINQGIFDEYYLIDVFQDVAKGNVLDVSDAIPWLPDSVKSVKFGKYEDCKDADIVVITAGLNQKPGESRLNLVEKNAKIIKEIAINIKESGFEGITIIASNPVDILTTIYQRVTGYSVEKVIGSGTCLDSARLRRLIGDELKVDYKNVEAYVIGEHGDSSVSCFSSVSISGISLWDFTSKSKFSDAKCRRIHKEVVNMAYKIINCKKATYYGIGAALAKICYSVVKDSNVILPVSVINKYSKNMYVGFPAIVNASGCIKPAYLKMTTDEIKGLKKSSTEMKKIFDKVIINL